jgi:hypothetical protein
MCRCVVTASVAEEVVFVVLEQFPEPSQLNARLRSSLS